METNNQQNDAEKFKALMLKMKKDRRKRSMRTFFLLSFIFICGFAIMKCEENKDSAKSEIAETKPVFTEHHALTAVEMALKENLNDPDSYERDSWNAWLQDSLSRKYRVRIQYRAKNAFGGVVRQSILAEVDSSYLVKQIE